MQMTGDKLVAKITSNVCMWGGESESVCVCISFCTNATHRATMS